jgi:hypothetical protein
LFWAARLMAALFFEINKEKEEAKGRRKEDV